MPKRSRAPSFRALSSNMATVVLGRLVALVVGLLTIGLMTRHLGADGYGDYRTILTLTAIAGIIAEQGLHLVILRELSEPNADRARTLGAGIVWRILTTSVVLLLMGFLAELLPYPDAIVTGVIFVAPFYICFQAYEVLQGVFQKHLKQGRQMAAETVGTLVTLALVYAAVLLNGEVLAMVLALVVGGVVQLAITWVMAAQLQPFRPRLDVAYWRHLFVTGLPIAGSRMAHMAILRGDILVLSLIDTNVAVGLYGVPSKIFEIVANLQGMLCGMMMPLFVVALAKQSSADIDRVLRGTTDTMVIIAGGMIACFAVFGSDILVLISGPEFAVANRALVLIGLGLIAYGIGNVYRTVLMSMNRQALALKADVVALLFAVVGYLVLIRLWSFEGAALATALVETVSATYLTWLAHREGMVPPRLATILKVTASVALTIAAMKGLSAIGLPWFPAMALSGIVYLGFLLAVRAIPLELLRTLAKKPPPAVSSGG